MKISVITVCYNCQFDLEKTILSVINQSYKNIEYIIIDGGSTDKTLDVIKKYIDKITYWVSEPDKGIYDAMNKGIRKATGDWINFMNAGDCFASPDVIAKLFSCNIIPNDIKFIYGDINFIKGSQCKHIHALPPKHIRHTMPCSHQALFVRNMENIFFNLKYKLASEYDVMFRFYVKQSTEIFLYKPIIVCNFDGNDGISSRYPVKAYEECIKIRAKQKDFLWYYDYFKLIIKKILKMN